MATSADSTQLCAEMKEKVKINLIFTEKEMIMPIFWLKNPVIATGFPYNCQVYFWNLDNEKKYKFSLHFLLYLKKYILKPSCCVQEHDKIYLGRIEGSIPEQDGARQNYFQCFISTHVKMGWDILLKLENICNCELNPDETLYLKLEEIPTEIDENIHQCLTCGVGRCYSCRNCLHFNIIIAEIIHHVECWTCFTPNFYLSNAIKSFQDEIYMYCIDARTKHIIMSWEKKKVQPCSWVMRLSIEKENRNEECNRPVALNWGFIELFQQCPNRTRVPKLKDSLIYYFATYNLNKNKDISHHMASEVPASLLLDIFLLT